MCVCGGGGRQGERGGRERGEGESGKGEREREGEREGELVVYRKV